MKMSDCEFTTEICGRDRRGYTLAELMLLVALAAILVAIFIDVRRQFSVYNRWIASISLSADGRRVAAEMMDGSVRVWDTATGETVGSLGPFGAPVYMNALALSSDGTLIARSRGDVLALEVFDLKSGTRLLNRQLGVVGGLAFSADGKRLAYQLDGAAKDLGIVNLDDSRSADATAGASTSAMYGECVLMSFSPDQESLWVVRGIGEFATWDLAGGQATCTSLVPQTKNAVHYDSAALSPTGNQMAVARSEYATATTATGAIQSISKVSSRSLVDVLDPRNPNSTRQILDSPDTVSSIAYVDSGKSLAILYRDRVELWDPQTLTLQKSAAFEQAFDHVAASPDGRAVTLSEQESIYLLEGNKLRKIVDLQPATSNLVFLFVAFLVVFAIWATIRRRRTARACPQCGKTWRERRRPKTGDATRCPDCRLEVLNTEQLTTVMRKRSRQRWLGLGVILFSIALLTALTSWDAENPPLRILLSLALWVAGLISLLIVLMIVLIWRQRRRLRRLADEGYSIEKARRAAGCEGRTERSGAIMLWTDVTKPEAETSLNAGWLSRELADCRKRVEEILALPCRPQETLQVYVFSKTAAAHKFLPSGPNADRPAVYCGPWAHVACLSLESARGHLILPEQLLRALLVYDVAGWPRSQAGFWLGFALANYVGRVTQSPGPDAWRRKMALWAAEGTLLPLKEIFKRRTASVSSIGAKRMLSEHYQNSLRVLTQLVSLMDYLVGTDSTPQRRQSLQRLWQAIGRRRIIEKACTEAFGQGMAELDRQWRFWAGRVAFDSPPLPPAEIAKAAKELVIPLLRDASAPIQRRIRAIRILGGCGWLVGADALVETLSGSHDDLRREALSALRLMFGRSGTESADDWRRFLEEQHGGARNGVSLGETDLRPTGTSATT
jgi:WD40 repeat protein